MRAPQEGGVIREARRVNIQPSQMPVYMAIDEIMNGTCGQCRLGSRSRHDRLKHRYLALEPRHHGSLPDAVTNRHRTLFIHLGHTHIVGMKHRLPCDIRLAAIRVAGDHLERLSGTEGQHRPRRFHAQRHYRRAFIFSKRQAAADPIV